MDSPIDSIALEAVGPPSAPRRSPASYLDTIDSDRAKSNGQPIDEYCDTRRLDVAARLKLLSQVCKAVHVAHQNGVIHGDLKPSNILVTAEGTPKLVGFGTTRLVHAEPDDAGSYPTTLTEVGETATSPNYASPEHVQGDPVTTASDIYGLGVILYLLLTGQKPYRLKTDSPAEILQAICEQVPEKPSKVIARRMGGGTGSTGPQSAIPSILPASSPDPEPALPSTPLPPTPEDIAPARRCSPQRLKRILAGDLDSIVLKALRKEPNSRYASAAHFAEDLKRYGEGLPVSAHHDSAVYRTVKFIRRHRATVAAWSLLILALAGGIAGATTAWIVARRQHDRAERSFLQARQAIDQLCSRAIHDPNLDQPELHPLRRRLLVDAQRFYESFLRDRADDPSLRAELAEARMSVARIVRKIGSPEDAAAQFQQAVKLWERLLATYPNDSAYQQSLALTLHDLGSVLSEMKGRREEARDAFGRAQELVERLVSVRPHSPALRRELTLILQKIAQLQFDAGQPNQAIETIKRALAIESQLAVEDPPSLESRISRARAHALLGQFLLVRLDDLELAIAADQQAVDLLEEVSHEHPELAEQAFELAMSLGDLSSKQQRVGELDSALASTQKALDVLERLNQRYPGLLKYQRGLASGYNMMSDLHRRRSELAEGLALAQKAQKMLERLVSEHAEDLDSRIELARSHNNRGRLLQAMDEPLGALQMFQHAIDLYESLPALDERNSYDLACNVALCIPLIGAKLGSANRVDVAKLSKTDRLRRQRYGDRAVELLRRALSGGLIKQETLEADSDLAAIRDRADFQELLNKAHDHARAGPG